MHAGTVERGDGVSIAYDVAGSGPPVVFVHGLTSSRTAWTPVTDLLRDRFTCVRLDLRGHGDSSTAGDYGTLALVGDAHAVVDALGLGQPALIGHSLGATLVAVYAAVHGARAVVCVDATLDFGAFARFLAPYADALRGPDTLETLAAIDHALGLAPYDGVAAMELRIRAFPRDVVLALWDAVLTTPPEELTARAEALLPHIAAPLLALHGAPPPPGYAEWLTAHAPQARVEVFDGLGHMLHLVDPARFASRVAAHV